MSISDSENELVVAFELDTFEFHPTEFQRGLFNLEIEFDCRRRRTYKQDVVNDVLEMFESAFGSRFDRNDYRSKKQLTDGLCIMGKENGPFGAEHFAIALDGNAESGFTAYHVKTDGGWGATIHGRKSLSEAMEYFRKCSTDTYCHDDYESDGYNPGGCEHCECGCRYCVYKRDWSDDEQCTGCFHGCRYCWDQCPDNDI